MPKKIEIDVDVNSEGAVRNTDKLAESLDSAASSTEKLSGETSELAGGLEEMGGAFGGAISGAKALGQQFLKLLANPIVAVIAGIVVVLGTLFKAFSRTEAGGNKLNKGFAILSGAVSSFFKVIEPVASFIVDVVVGAFEQLGKAADTASKIVEGALDLFGFDEAAESVRNFNSATKQLLDDTTKLADLEAQLLKGRREQSLIEKQALIDAENLRQLRDDESLSIDERIKKNEQLGEVLETQLGNELEIANKALKAAELRLKIDGETTENLDALAEAQLEILDINERINGQQSEQLANLNSLRNEQKAAAEEARKAAEERRKAAEEEARKAEEARQAELKAEQDRADAIFKIEEELRLSKLESEEAAREKSIAAVNAEFDEKFRIAEGNAELEAELFRTQQQRINEINEEFAAKRLEAERAAKEKELQTGLEFKQLRYEAGLDDPNITPEELIARFEAQQEAQAEIDALTLEKAQIDFENGLITQQERDLILLQQKEKQAKEEEKINNIKIENEKRLQQAVTDAAVGGLNVLASLNEDSKELQAAAMIADSAVAIGKTVVNTQAGNAAALALGIAQAGPIAGPPLAAPAIAANNIQAGLSIAGIVAGKAKALAGLKKSGGGSASTPPLGSAPSGGSASAPALSSDTLFASSDVEGQETEEIGTGAGINQVKAIVVESDITKAQNNVSGFREASEIG